MNAEKDRYEALAAETEREHAEAWRPKPGDVLVGEYVRRDSGVSSYDGRSHPIAVVRDRAGKEWGVWAFHTVLRQQLAAARPRIGEPIAIRYKGKRQGASGTSYNDWSVAVERAEREEDDWEAQAGDAEFAVNGEGTAEDDIPF
jgi:hypothetical protein